MLLIKLVIHRSLRIVVIDFCLSFLFQLKEVLSKVPDDLLRKPLFTGVLTDKQWFRLAKIQTELHTDYTIRREMLLKRLDVTVLSFEVGPPVTAFIQ